jgi:multidrug resistance efflux pump
MSETRRQIKVPPAQIWREFRMRFLPFCVFIFTLFAAVKLWNVTVMGPTLVGEVEAVQTAVVSTETGVVTNLLVRRFQLVKAGDPVAEIVSLDPRTMSSHVQDLRSQIAMSQLELTSAVDRERMAMDYQNMAMNTMRFKADLAAARAELPTLEAGAKRAEDGWNAKVVPYNDYELAIRMRDSVKARVAELETLVRDAESRVAQASTVAGAFTNMAADATLPQTVDRLRQERKEVENVRRTRIVLQAPIDGTVGMIMRRPGENVLAGDIVLTINSLEADRIYAYVRPGTIDAPKRGTPVRVRCRSRLREEGVSKVEEIGYHFEAITNQALIRPGAVFELGMPIAVGMPPSLRALLKPGELVDISID